MKRMLLMVSLLGALPALADEGMWTFDNFPSAQVKQKYGFEPTQAWLDKVRLASARLSDGCSASFVSGNGLVMTNHHCARGCIQQLSTAKQDFLANGFYARTPAQERTCPAMEVNQLLSITDVTAEVDKATQGLTGKAYAEAQKAKLSKLEKACATADDVRCDVVTLYQGGKYNLYRYKRFQDVRLVMAPEHAIAFFGGDPDNFEYPRYDWDVTFLRVYEGGKPAATPHHFQWSAHGPKEGEPTFLSGNPGRTSRGLTVAELEYQRDVALPVTVQVLSELRGMLTEFRRRGPEQARIASNVLFGTENRLKALRGRHEALVDKAFFAQKEAQEQALREKVEADPELKKLYGGAWDEIARATAKLKDMRKEVDYVGELEGFSGSLFTHALRLVRAAEELPKEDSTRLRGYNDAALPALKAAVHSTAPIYPELEVARLTFSLTKMREILGPDHPFVKKVLGKESPESLARRVVKGSRLADVRVRKALFAGGKQAVDASKDTMITLAKWVDGDSRAVRKAYEEDVEAVIRKNSERVARARFAVYGTGIYPDATFSPRVTYGAVKGYLEEGKPVPAMTQIGGAFERHTGEEPFRLPQSWLAAKDTLALGTPMNFASTNDIIGGNSGSPVINKEAEIVGLVFDGNIQSLGGEYGFDESANRAVSVHSDAIIEALEKVYGATRVLEELRPGSTGRKVGAAPAH